MWSGMVSVGLRPRADGIAAIAYDNASLPTATGLVGTCWYPSRENA